MKIAAALFFFLFPFFASAQPLCPGWSKVPWFQANKIGAHFSSQGISFLDGAEGGFKVPFSSFEVPWTIYASSPWLACMVNGEPRVAAQTYVSVNLVDYYPGPILTNGNVVNDPCRTFNRVWTVYRQEIERHKLDFQDNGVIDDPNPSIFGWPANGNPYFEVYNGFPLPQDHVGGWADFNDSNQNGIFEPQFGEYPVVSVENERLEPEQIMWMVFNDQGEHWQSGGVPIGIEIQRTVYGFNCVEDGLLNTSLFVRYRLLNQSNQVLDSLHFGLWSDYDLGCSEDDYMGCDTLRHTEFVYNKDAIDGDKGYCTGTPYTYGDLPPVQSVTYLSHPLHAFTWAYFKFQETASEFYNSLKGLWPDGTAMRAVGNGIDEESLAPITRYLFHGDPQKPNDWAQINLDSTTEDPSLVSSLYLGQMLPEGQEDIHLVYMFHQDSTENFLSQIAVMQAAVDQMRADWPTNLESCTLYPACQDISNCVWPGDFNHDGRADHFDILAWGLAHGQTGPKRDGLIHWTGHAVDDWSAQLPDGVYMQHADGNGDGKVDQADIDRNIQHFLLTTPFYQPEAVYPVGPEIEIVSRDMEPDGDIKALRVRIHQDIDNVFGMAYELDFDTTLYHLSWPSILVCPDVQDIICLREGVYEVDAVPGDVVSRYAFVMSVPQSVMLQNGDVLEVNIPGLSLRPGKTMEDVPDTVVVRLRNLIAIDPLGHDLKIGAMPLKVPKPLISHTQDVISPGFQVYPNPVNEVLYVESDKNCGVCIFNILGQEVRQYAIKSGKQEIDIGHLPSGFYMLRLLPGDQVFTFYKQ